MAARSAVAGCSRIQSLAYAFRPEGSLKYLTANISTCLETKANSKSNALLSVDSLAKRLENELVFSESVTLQNDVRINHQNVLDQTNLKVIINPGMSNNIAIGFPGVDVNSFELPGLSNVMDQQDKLIYDENLSKVDLLLSSVLKKRRKKMNKHKYKKRIHRDKARIRTVKYFRLRRKKRKQAFLKKRLQEKIKRIQKQHPNSDYCNRPYVVFRLKNW